MWTTQYVKFCNIPCNYQQYRPSQGQKRGHLEHPESLGAFPVNLGKLKSAWLCQATSKTPT